MYKIYQITNKKNNKSYIGFTKLSIQQRFKTHLKRARNKVNRRLYDSINHHGPENFVLSLVEDDLTEEEAKEREIYWIKEKNTLIPNGYNMTLGGDGGHTTRNYTEEQRRKYIEKLSASQKNRWKTFKFSEETKLKISNMNKGKTITSEQRAKISKTLKDKISSGDYKPNISGLRPHIPGEFKHNKESKVKLSKARKGKKYEDVMSVETVKRIKERKRKDWLSSKNPNYVEFPETLKKEILEYLTHNRCPLSEITERFTISNYKLKQWLKPLGVDNYQHIFRKNKTMEEWTKYWRNLYEN